MEKVRLHLDKLPEDDEALLEWADQLFRQLTGREPTPEDNANCRAELGLPTTPIEDVSKGREN